MQDITAALAPPKEVHCSRQSLMIMCASMSDHTRCLHRNHKYQQFRVCKRHRILFDTVSDMPSMSQDKVSRCVEAFVRKTQNLQVWTSHAYMYYILRMPSHAMHLQVLDKDGDNMITFSEFFEAASKECATDEAGQICTASTKKESQPVWLEKALGVPVCNAPLASPLSSSHTPVG